MDLSFILGSALYASVKFQPVSLTIPEQQSKPPSLVERCGNLEEHREYWKNYFAEPIARHDYTSNITLRGRQINQKFAIYLYKREKYQLHESLTPEELFNREDFDAFGIGEFDTDGKINAYLTIFGYVLGNLIVILNNLEGPDGAIIQVPDGEVYDRVCTDKNGRHISSIVKNLADKIAVIRTNPNNR